MSGDPRSLDRAARREARTVFDVPLVLEAGAGTGKTATLVARVVCWCLGPGWERAAERLAGRRPRSGSPGPEEVAVECLGRVTAITFTEKAAGEMADRCAEAFEVLARARGGEEPALVGLPVEDLPVRGEELHRRATALALRVDRLVATTIHGFCARLLRAWPLEAGIHPGFEIDADGRRIRAIAEEVAADRGAAAEPREMEDLAALAAAGIGPRELAEALAALLSSGATPGELSRDPLPPARRVRLVRDAGEVAARLLEVLDGSGWSGDVSDRVRGVLARVVEVAGQGDLGALRDALGGETGDQLEEDLQRLVKRNAKPVTLLDAGEVPGFERLCRMLRDQLRDVRRLDPAVLGALHRVLGSWLAVGHERMLAEGAIGFDGLLAGAHRLLADRPRVLRRVRASIDQLLVDEVQDTDPLQYEIVRLLALEEEPGPRPGLFVVGDPKQSIYGFRSADLAAYEAFLERVRAAGGEVHPLVVNFRSVPAVLGEVERAVAPLMELEPGVQPAWEGLVPSPANEGAVPDLPGNRAPVEYWVSWDGLGEGETPTDRARQLEAEAIARDIRDRLDADPSFRPGGVALLLRATTAQGPYLEALRDAGIPCVVERERDWTRRRDVVELAAVVRAVVDPLDQVALLAALRAPFAAVPDAALPRLWRRGLPGLAAALGEDPHAAERLAALLEEVAGELRGHADEVPGLGAIEGWEQAAIHFVEVLAELRGAFRRERTDAFVRRLADRLLPMAEAAARWQGDHRVARQRAFLRRLLERLRGLAGSPRQVLRALREATAGLLEEPVAAAVDPSADAVHLLTIHKAKGLTFDEVYVVDLHHGRSSNGRGDGPRVVREGDELLVAAPGMALPGDAARNARTRRRELAEEVRTFYVAVTRPRLRLVLCGRWPRPGSAGREVSLVDRLAGGRPAPLQEMLEAGERDRVEPDGVRWRILGGGEEDPARRARGSRVAIPDPRPEIEEARERRRTAAERSAARPLLAPSSAAEEAAAEDEPDDPLAVPSDPRERDVLLAAGTVVHRLLELFDPGTDPVHAWERLVARRLADLVRAAAVRELVPAVEREVREILAGFPESDPFARLVEIAHGILGREVPLVLVADPKKERGFAWSGTIDLLYRDPGTGRIVVADYKTDRASGDQERKQLVDRYAEQLDVYARGVERAFGLDYRPRCELWFLREGKIQVVAEP